MLLLKAAGFAPVVLQLMNQKGTENKVTSLLDANVM